MIKLAEITPGVTKKNVLISVNALVDLDVGMYKLIHEEYLDPEVFDAEFLNNGSILDYIQTSYFRSSDNPLYPIAVIDDNRLLDEYCAQFIQTEYNTIYDKSTYTDVLELVRLLVGSKEVDVTIFHYGNYVGDQLINDIEEGVIPDKVGILNALALKGPVTFNKYDQIYVRSIYELDELPITQLTSPKHFYISSFRPNFTEKGELKKTKSIENIQMSKLMHNIHIFGLYNSDNIKKPSKGDKK